MHFVSQGRNEMFRCECEMVSSREWRAEREATGSKILQKARPAGPGAGTPAETD